MFDAGRVGLAMRATRQGNERYPFVPTMARRPGALLAAAAFALVAVGFLVLVLAR